MSDRWPWLFEECLFTEGLDPRWCGLCGASTDLEVWRECDGQDKPTVIFVALCKACANFRIDPHERLFLRTQVNEPLPGCMSLCLDCRWRAGTICLHLSSIYRGGEGMRKLLTYPEPTAYFWDGADKRGASDWRPSMAFPRAGVRLRRA